MMLAQRRTHVTFSYLMCHVVQIAWCNLRNDGQRRDRGGCGDPNAVVFWGPLLNANKHISHGNFDDGLHSSSDIDVFPSMGRHVLWPFLRSCFA